MPRHGFHSGLQQASDGWCCLSAGASLTSLYTSTNALPVYQVAVDLSSVVFNIVVTGGLPVSVNGLPLQLCHAATVCCGLSHS